MAQNNNSSKGEGLCHKIHNAVNPFKSRTRRTSHQPRPSVSITGDKKPSAGTTQNPVRTSSRQTNMVPVELGHGPTEGKPPNHVKFAKARSEKDDEGKFSDYISKVKNRMMKTASNVGGGRVSPRRDSFNDKVTNYIKHAKMKIRKTSTIGVEKHLSIK